MTATIRLCTLILCCLLAGATVYAQDVVALGDFEEAAWRGLSQSDEQVKEGEMAGKWTNLADSSTLYAPDVPDDWSRYDRLTFWLYSATANNQRLTLVAESENDEREGWDYFFHHMRVDWTGWKHISLDLREDFGPGRTPVGWHTIDRFRISAGGWGNTPLEDTVLYFDDVRLVRDPASVETGESQFTWDGDAVTGAVHLSVTNRSAEDASFGLAVRRPESASGPHIFTADLPETTGTIPPGESTDVAVSFHSRPDLGEDIEPLRGEDFVVHVSAGHDQPSVEVTVSAMVPLPNREHPMLFGNEEVFERAKQRAEEYDWAAERLHAIIHRGDEIVAEEINIPDQGGQWSHYYVCEKCNHRLQYNAEDDTHMCRNCGAVYDGWPYDEVRYTYQHNHNWRNIRDLGLAYEFSGEEKYAEKAREYLLDYAEKYPTFDLHDKRGNKGRSGGRAFSQTLNEGVGVIAPAWGYDLIYNSPCLSDEDRDRIENRFFREVVKTIKRHDAGISNWQSWHNAGIAAVGFCLQDESIAYDAINGRSGLRFQLENSVLEDGFWYEGTAAYHFYALNALRWTVEAAYHAGMDFYSNEAYVSLYEAPLYYVFPNMQFPAVNDSDIFSLTGRDELYELIYARTQRDPFVMVAKHGNRGSLEAFLWGVDELPDVSDVKLESRNYTGLGAAILRQGVGDQQQYLHLDYGPHGGGHGHLDKLAMILFDRGRELAPDPGRLAYAAPLQKTWYKHTFAHNTVCVDEKDQARAEGELTLFHSEPGFAAAQAECDTAYSGVTMRRTMAITGEYVIDIFDLRGDEDHTYDWLYHNFGTLQPGVQTEAHPDPLSDGDAYQHFTDIAGAQTGEDWSAVFELDDTQVAVSQLGAEGTEIYFGMGIAGKPPQDCPMIVSRRTGQTARYISLIEPKDAGASSHSLSRLDAPEGVVALCIESPGGTDLFVYAPEGGEHTIEEHTVTGCVCFIADAGGDNETTHEIP